ncbi:hypothetical protein DITRI_Ditri04bG0095100 [Diplodiscus trichospermus]
MNYYPPCAQASKVIGLAPHSDATGLTLLIQVNEVEGLQIKKNGKWVRVKPITGAFIINIGDVIEIMSNGEYKSTEANLMEKKIKISVINNTGHKHTFLLPKQDYRFKKFNHPPA